MFFVLFQTCYEMERYLKDEPKLQSYKKLPSELDSWGAWEAVTKVEVHLDERHLDNISMGSASSGCSRLSWDSQAIKQVSTF